MGGFETNGRFWLIGLAHPGVYFEILGDTRVLGFRSAAAELGSGGFISYCMLNDRYKGFLLQFSRSFARGFHQASPWGIHRKKIKVKDLTAILLYPYMHRASIQKEDPIEYM